MTGVLFRRSWIWIPGLLAILVSGACISTVLPIQHADREREGLLGPVSKVVAKSGVTTTTKTFDGTGTLIEVESRVSPPADQLELGDSVETLVYTYDPKGNRTAEMILEPDGERYPSRLYAYDRVGHRLAEAAYHMCGTFSSLQIYRYDANGQMRENLVYQSRSLSRHVYSYDDRGRIVQSQLHRNGTVQSATSFIYDQHDRLTEQRVYLSDGGLYSTASYQYDDRGNRTGEAVMHSTQTSLNSKEVAQYEYDSAGNWTRRTTHRLIIPVDDSGVPLSEPTKIVERRITYH
jgi:hypothetical protein